MNLILFGFKGSGKTHFGKLLAHTLKRPFIDTDDLIVELYHMQTSQRRTVRQIYEHLGQYAFRALESQTIPLLQRLENTIIALGGGYILDPSNLQALQKIGSLVFLRASATKLKSRIFKEELPAFANDEEALLTLIHEREPIYASIPARQIDTDALDEAGILAELRSILVLEDPPNGL